MALAGGVILGMCRRGCCADDSERLNERGWMRGEERRNGVHCQGTGGRTSEAE